MKRTMPCLAGLLVLIAGCASDPVPSRAYLLRPPPASVQAEPGAVAVSLEPVRLAAYLEQRGIVLALDEDEIRPARLHRWAEPLGEAVRRYLQVTIAAEAGRAIGTGMADPDSIEERIEVAIHRLHATRAGEAILVAEWRIVDAESTSARVHRNHARTVPLAASGYPGIVQAHQELLAGLAAEIAAVLRAPAEEEDDG